MNRPAAMKKHRQRSGARWGARGGAHGGFAVPAILAAALALGVAPGTLASAMAAPPSAGRPAAPGKPAAAPLAPQANIVAVVNGDVISNDDVDNRTKLFALSTGLPMTPEVLDRLRPQITRQLIDERLRLQEIQRRKIVVPDQTSPTRSRRSRPATACRPARCASGWPPTGSASAR